MSLTDSQPNPSTDPTLATDVIGEFETIREESTRLSSVSGAIAAMPVTNQVTLQPALTSGTVDNLALARSDVVFRPRQDLFLDRLDRTQKIYRFREDWEIAKQHRVPIKVIEPVPAKLGAPIIVGEFRLWVDPSSNRVYYALTSPRLRHFSLTIRREAVNNTIKITGGTAVLEASVYAEDSPQVLEQYRPLWTKQIATAGYGDRFWSFQRMELRNLQASIEVSPGVFSQPPQITTNSSIGRITALMELSEMGVQIWKSALEARQGIPGLLKIDASSYAEVGASVSLALRGPSTSVVAINLSVLFAKLLETCGPESITNANLQLSTEAKFLVNWHFSLQSVVVNWQPNNGGAPGSYVFDAASSPLSILLTAQDLNTLEVNWNAKVSFKDPSWPPITESGKLRLADNDFTYILKPTAWVQDFMIIVSMLDAAGNAIPSSTSAADLNNRVMGVMNFSAPYLPKRLTEAFETSSQQIRQISFPVLASQPAELELSLVSQRNGRDDFQTRRLRLEENLIFVKVYDNARIEIITTQDRVPESSLESEIFGLLSML